MLMRLGGGRRAGDGKGEEDAGQRNGDASALKLPERVEATLANVRGRLASCL
jgi:hypothetical protein